MKPCPETPRIDGATEFSGHVWVQELPTGAAFRFTVAPAGFVTFATADGVFDSAASVPVAFRRAARSIDDRLDRDALGAATDTPGAITFCGVATRNEGADYDWGTLPPFVGTDVWAGESERFLSPDAATGVFERLGLPTLPAVQKELPAAQLDIGRFEEPAGFPTSNWRDGPAAGVLVRDKAGGRGAAWAAESADASASTGQSAGELAATYATGDRIERTAAAMRDSGATLSVDAIRDRLVADLAREAYAELFADEEFVASLSAFESAVAERVQRHQFTDE